MAEDIPLRVHFIDDTTRIVPAKDIQYVGDESARRAIAIVDGRVVPIYTRPDWPDPWTWEEQMSMDEWLACQGDGSGLHQCPYCYNLVNAVHEEFCSLNPHRNRNIVL